MAFMEPGGSAEARILCGHTRSTWRMSACEPSTVSLPMPAPRRPRVAGTAARSNRQVARHTAHTQADSMSPPMTFPTAVDQAAPVALAMSILRLLTPVLAKIDLR